MLTNLPFLTGLHHGLIFLIYSISIRACVGDCYPHPSGGGLLWLLKFYNIFVFLLFPQQHNTFTTVSSQNILDEVTKMSCFRPHPNTALIDQSKLTTFPQETALLIFPALPGLGLWDGEASKSRQRQSLGLTRPPWQEVKWCRHLLLIAGHVSVVARRRRLAFSWVCTASWQRDTPNCN